MCRSAALKTTIGPDLNKKTADPDKRVCATAGKWMRNLVVAGGAIGCLFGVGLGVQTHLPVATRASQVFRFGLAGAAVGASIPAGGNGAGFAILAALWLALGAVLWVIASALTGRTNWLTRLSVKACLTMRAVGCRFIERCNPWIKRLRTTFSGRSTK